MIENIRLTKSAWFVAGMALVMWVLMFIFADFTTTTVVKMEGREQALQKAPSDPISWEEMERRTEQAREALRRKIDDESHKLRNDQFLHVRTKSYLWTWIPWSICVLIFGLKRPVDFFILIATCVFLFLIRVISLEALLITAFSVFIFHWLRFAVIQNILSKHAK